MEPQFEYSSDVGPSLLAVPILRLGDVDSRIANFIDSKILDWFIQEVYDPIIHLATGRGHAQRWIDAIHAVKPGFCKVQLVADRIKTPNGLDLFDMLENGFGHGGYTISSHDPDDHWLAWTGGKYGPGWHYAPAVFHPGFSGYHLFDSVKNWGFVDRFLDKIKSETEKYVEETKFQ